ALRAAGGAGAAGRSRVRPARGTCSAAPTLAVQQANPQEPTVMTRQRRGEDGGPLRGFARMEPSKQRELARKGGANVPSEKRSFSQSRALASEAGRKGGRHVAPQSRSFSKNRSLAAEAGRKGGRMSQRRRVNAHGSPNGAV